MRYPTLIVTCGLRSPEWMMDGLGSHIFTSNMEKPILLLIFFFLCPYDDGVCLEAAFIVYSTLGVTGFGKGGGFCLRMWLLACFMFDITAIENGFLLSFGVSESCLLWLLFWGLSVLRNRV